MAPIDLIVLCENTTGMTFSFGTDYLTHVWLRNPEVTPTLGRWFTVHSGMTCK
jgi:hypothetical protein